MEAVVQILDAAELAPIMPIPEALMHHDGKANQQLLQKFREAAESGEAKERLKKKLAQGTQFDFEAEKLVNGTMTETDWQKLYALQKQAWSEAIAEKGKNIHRA